VPINHGTLVKPFKEVRAYDFVIAIAIIAIAIIAPFLQGIPTSIPVNTPDYPLLPPSNFIFFEF
jgi:hypothetical protein